MCTNKFFHLRKSSGASKQVARQWTNILLVRKTCITPHQGQLAPNLSGKLSQQIPHGSPRRWENMQQPSPTTSPTSPWPCFNNFFLSRNFSRSAPRYEHGDRESLASQKTLSCSRRKETALRSWSLKTTALILPDHTSGATRGSDAMVGIHKSVPVCSCRLRLPSDSFSFRSTALAHLLRFARLATHEGPLPPTNCASRSRNSHRTDRARCEFPRTSNAVRARCGLASFVRPYTHQNRLSTDWNLWGLREGTERLCFGKVLLSPLHVLLVTA